MPINRKGGPWKGGYISISKSGRKTYFIEREVRGLRFHVSTRTHDERAAFRHLDRFESDPVAYRPEGVNVARLLLTNELVNEYEQFLLVRRRVTNKHASNMVRCLADWMTDLGEQDLRKLGLATMKQALDARRACRQARIIAIKAFFGWLRKEKGLMRAAEDATLDLPVPQGIPAKYRKRKVVEWERVQAVAEKLEPRYRDVLTLMAATGMHVTELERFIRDDDAALIDAPAGASYLAVLCVLHKSGEWTRTPLLHEDHVAAASRLRLARKVPRRLNQALKEACFSAKVTAFTFGVLRHSVGTWAVEDGADPAKVSRFLGHKDPNTTRRFYLDLNIPTDSIPTRQLRLVKA